MHSNQLKLRANLYPGFVLFFFLCSYFSSVFFVCKPYHAASASINKVGLNAYVGIFNLVRLYSLPAAKRSDEKCAV